MSRHADPAARLSFSQWRRYRRFLAALITDAHKHGYNVTPGALDVMKAEARAAARSVR